MRTVTFSDPTVASVLNEKFVCTWVNREPGFHNCSFVAEQWISAKECFATKNFCTFFATPELEVLHYASGFFGPRMFLEELKSVFDLKRDVLDLKNRFMEDSYPEFKAAHQLHAKEHRELAAVLEKDRRNPGRHIDRIQGLRHLGAVHEDLVAKFAAKGGPVALESVFKTYLFGNPFEEHKGSREGPPRDPRTPGMQ
jgi:hypothetical protein